MPYVKKKEFLELLQTRNKVINRVIEILQKYPRRDNYTLNGRKVSADYIIQEEIKNIT